MSVGHSLTSACSIERPMKWLSIRCHRLPKTRLALSLRGWRLRKGFRRALHQQSGRTRPPDDEGENENLRGPSEPSTALKSSLRLRSVVSTARKQGCNILQTLAAAPSDIMLALTA